MNLSAVENLARAKIDMEMGFTDAALVHALIALASLQMTEEELQATSTQVAERIKDRVHRV